jgi:hypothetical protein
MRVASCEGRNPYPIIRAGARDLGSMWRAGRRCASGASASASVILRSAARIPREGFHRGCSGGRHRRRTAHWLHRASPPRRTILRAASPASWHERAGFSATGRLSEFLQPQFLQPQFLQSYLFLQSYFSRAWGLAGEASGRTSVAAPGTRTKTQQPLRFPGGT